MYEAEERKPRYGKFTVKMPWWMIHAIFEESDKTYTPAAVLVVNVLRKYLQDRGYGPKGGEEDGG
ncbi:MAG: hypothetical protein QXT77_05290 [Candidatus Methanomethylicaceae archaeon]